jgi:type IV secretion system pilin
MIEFGRLMAAVSDKIPTGKDGVNVPVVTDPNAVVSGILTAVYAWAGIICVLIIIIAGYLYVTANANAQRIKRAKDAILYAIVGLVVIMMAFVITQFVIGRF